MRYLLVDSIGAWTPGEQIQGSKNIAMSEDFLEFHFPGNPVMPGVLMLEAMTQLAGWLEAASSDFRNWLLIAEVKNCRFYRLAVPGDRIELTVTFLPGPAPGQRSCRGIGTVGGKKTILAEFTAGVVALEELESADEQRKLFQVLTRGQVKGD